MIADYTKLRVAFGKPIGSNHRVEHKCSDIENAKSSLTDYAAWAIDEKHPNAPLAVWMADASHKVSNMDPAASRHRHDLGAGPALLHEAGEGERRRVRGHHLAP
jgi:alkylation response protein AidB-like acyl-CoA dehydrogenase